MIAARKLSEADKPRRRQSPNNLAEPSRYRDLRPRSSRTDFALLHFQDSVSENSAWQRKNQAGGLCRTRPSASCENQSHCSIRSMRPSEATGGPQCTRESSPRRRTRLPRQGDRLRKPPARYLTARHHIASRQQLNSFETVSALYDDAKKKSVDWLASRQLKSGNYDLFHGWSGSSLRSLRAAKSDASPPCWRSPSGTPTR